MRWLQLQDTYTTNKATHLSTQDTCINRGHVSAERASGSLVNVNI